MPTPSALPRIILSPAFASALRFTRRGSTRPMATGYGNTGSPADRFTALENSPDRLERQLVDRHRHQRQREERASAHGVHIRDRVGRGYCAKVERIVHDRHEEVGR